MSSSGTEVAPHELTFWPSSVTSLTPFPASRVTSATISPGRRLTSRPRTAGTMQYAHFELQPIETWTHAWNGRSRCIGRVAANRRSSAIPKLAARDADAARAEPLAEVRDRARPERDVDERVPGEDALALRLRVAAADRDHALGVALLQHLRVAEVRREPRVGLLADRAGVEDEHVGLLGRTASPRPSSSSMPLIRSESCAFIWQPNVVTWYRRIGAEW